MKKLLKFMRGYGRECFLGPLFKLLEATFELFIPLVVAGIVDKGIGGGDRGYIVRMCLILVALGVIGLMCAVTAQYFAARAAVGFSTRLRHALMERILGLSYSQMDTLGASTMVTRMTSDVNQVQSGVNLTLRLLLRSPFVVFGAMIMAFTIDAQAALIFVGVIPVLCVIVFGIMLITMPMYRRVQAGLDQVTSATRQNLTGVRVLRAFCKEDAEVAGFAGKTRELMNRQLSAGGVSALMNPVTYVIINLAVILLVQVGAVKVDGGILSQGLVIALYNYMSQILVELIKMADLIINMTKAAACGGRIAKVLELENDQESGSRGADSLRGAVEFRDVTAKYVGAGEPSLEHISFTAAPGQTIGVIGGTGSGKTTLVNLIPRFYDAAEGEVLLDGVNAADYDLEALRQRIAVVPQKAELFKGTIRQNLLWGNPGASEEDLWQALETAQASEVVRDKPGMLEFCVEQGGVNFSGGQRQRLTIARALVRRPAVLILDDSASALDYATDANLRIAIRNMKNPPTTFIVSQRAASVRYADRILVLDDGLLVGTGTHDELLKTCAVYQEVYYSQFPKEAADDGKAE
ncbi:MAG: ABC transporter ATP-binding protein/permease [Clostridiales bacterium]|nr:ABC transporter ATP-binding protein/permease [Clostridiales bacterium]MCI7574044.1 ABC transporter ATP-binding protein/permease [Clostridiales bacterium]